ncbi:hypothetical protein GNI_011100 [Gregarina niphandrodes]|uniref:Uncharacterized protein n=1 Tax=Gregarina niphandrodes TaxID=110365 RepID=A0A023BCS8_GRENI|nr:hypothetical protein GNI_011100 [Gregarina niphandrodes]EZG86043.1 hypothetical protein GNI_011100 [Gregarina niphandrodes]|eukprot:XP_011128798.1 hypothetical protein GNI_011100 [Gregarina niphandrodes]
MPRQSTEKPRQLSEQRRQHSEKPPPTRSAKHLLQTYVTAYKAACTQENYFLYPKRVFEDVATGQQLMRQVEILTPFLWYCEQSRKIKEHDLINLRACWIRMKDEADLVL